MNQDIAIFLPGLYGGGAERTMLSLAEEFSLRGHSVDIVVAREEGKFLNEVPTNVNLVNLKARSIPGYEMLGAIPGLRRYLITEQPDGLLSALYRANIIAVLARELTSVKTSIVVSERNHLSTYLEYASISERVVVPHLIKATYPRADGIIGISKGVADDLAESTQLSRDSIDVVYNPAKPVNVESRCNESVQHPWLSADEPLVLGVGSLSRQKDFPTLIKAFASLQSRYPSRLIILGEGEQRKELERIASRHDVSDRIDLVGFVDNPLAYMAQADVFALSSKWEGFGNVLVEALACGTPVVSTDCPSGPREILADGQYGSLVPVGDPDALSEGIADVLTNPPNSSVLRDRASYFSRSRSGDGYLNILFKQKSVQ